MAQAIGEVECDRKACDGTMEVYRFQERSGRGSQFKNKYWAKCSKCGSVTGRNGEQSATDYILDKGKIWGANDTKKDGLEGSQADQSTQQTQTVKPSQPSQSKPSSQPSQTAHKTDSQPKKSSWGPLIQ